MQFAKIGDITLYYEHTNVRPDRPLLVFCNSLGTDFRIWNQLRSLLEPEMSTLCYDLRGHGLSGEGQQPSSIRDNAFDLAGLVDLVGATGVIICGLSVGGMIAQAFYNLRPNTVRGLILCDTAHKIGTYEFWNSRIKSVQESGIEFIADSILARWFSPTFGKTEPESLDGYRAMLVRQSVVGYVGTCAAIRDADHTEIVTRINVPTLCIAGDQDGSTPPDLVASMADLIPGSEFHILPGAGHLPCVEQPRRMADIVNPFLDKMSRFPIPM